ncbi:ABC transporter permease [Homoserinibacter sp. YIM 151385]|uniref:ABC transporter permease n=1 Tax=Homoserinibacter sp. YIM 151385 TaxID=2985506 RepID=UPI0022F07DB9|nr:ABC transporter permease [Homoserinibacter sp. YIM 151385]WBU38180.1 ABC transporter permease [Homoserinibacter sp. YIM 151385]
MNAIAASELRMLVRNRLVAVSALLVPLGFGALLLAMPGAYGGGGLLAGLQVMVMAGMGLYVTVATVLAGRRQSLHLKRLRSGAVSDRAIIAGIVAPVVGVNIVAIGIILAAAAVRGGPENWAVVVLGALVTQAMFLGLSLATAGVTNSPEHAQYTTLPVFLATTGVAIWSTFATEGRAEIITTILPGGAAMQLVQLGWDGGDLARLPLLLAVSLAWAALGALVAKRLFRWDARR